MEEPLVSISCITYNHVNYIRECIEGFLIQKTTFAFEVLIHDDASTDGTTKIIKEYEKKYPHIIKPIYESENQWIKGKRGSAFFNYPRAKGKYIALCEGDDFWIDSLKLQKQVTFLEENKDYGLVHTDINYVDKFSNLIQNPVGLHTDIKKKIKNGCIFELYLNSGGFILTATSMFRKSLLDITGVQQWFVYDLWLFMDIARKSKVYYIPEKTASYRRSPDGLMMSNRSFFKIYTPNILLDQIFRFYDKRHATLQYYLDKPFVKKEIIICYTRLLLNVFNGILKDKCKLIIILKHNPIFILKIPYYALYILLNKIVRKK